MQTRRDSEQLQAALDNTNLYISNCCTQLEPHRFDGLEDVPGAEDAHALSDPAIVASDVAADSAFQYLEQKAKDGYVKVIVFDDAPLITASSNEALRLRNEGKKRALKAVKATLAPLVEEDYQQARALTSRTTTLAPQILDARLALTRLHQAYPHPRLTIASTTSALDEQVTQMQEKEDELQGLNGQPRNEWKPGWVIWSN